MVRDLDYGSEYATARRAMIELVRAHPDELGTRMQATPDWVVKDVLAHVVGATADANAGNVADIGGDEWTNAQVEARSEATVEELIAEWEREAPAFEDGLRALGTIAVIAVADLTSHEHDARHALAHPGGRDTERTKIAYEYYVDALAQRIGDEGLPALRLVADGDDFIAGDGEPAATLSASRFELLRALTGRRSAAQVADLPWTGDSAPYLGLISSYDQRDDDLDE